MRSIHWFEAKQLDRATNFSTEVEIIKAGLNKPYGVYYYCTFHRCKKFFGLKEQITYLGISKNRYLKFIEFTVLVVLKAVLLNLRFRNIVLMVNQDLVPHMIIPMLVNRLFNRKNKFVVDLRTIPVIPETFDRRMKIFHFKYQLAVKYFDGFSFITPFMEQYVIGHYKEFKNYRKVYWSSGVDMDLFNPKLHLNGHNCNSIRLFYHGAISISRGNLDLIKACEKLVSKGYSIQLIQVGDLYDHYIYEYVRDSKLGRWCKLYKSKPIDEIPEMISRCDLPVLPFPFYMQWRVSSPIKLMEYLAMGKKVLAPDLECFTDVFGVKSDLVYYYNSSVEDNISNLFERLKEILDSKILTGESKLPLRDFVKNKYTWTKQADNLFKFCDNL